MIYLSNKRGKRSRVPLARCRRAKTKWPKQKGQNRRAKTEGPKQKGQKEKTYVTYKSKYISNIYLIINIYSKYIFDTIFNLALLEHRTAGLASDSEHTGSSP